jgi:hypothetical protein
LGELVQDRVNGRVFSNASELATQLQTLLRPPRAELATYRRNLADFRHLTWQVNWNRVAQPVLLF